MMANDDTLFEGTTTPLTPLTPLSLVNKKNLISGYQVKDPENRAGQMAITCRNDRRIPSIFRYPNFLKDSKSEKAYVPQAVSLGPYHSSRANLSGMDDHKKRARDRMMTRFNYKHGNHPHNRELYNSASGKISQDEEAVWNNYEEKFADKPCDLVLDGCFLLEILRTLGGDDELFREGSNYYEPIFERRKIQFTGFDILNDILKVENQIPLIVLRNLLQLEFKSVDTADEFLFNVLVKTPGAKFYPFDYDMGKWSWPQPVEQVHHLLGLLHSLIVSPPPSVSPPSNDRVSPPSNDGDVDGKENDDRCIPCAVELSNAGIKFEPIDGGIKKIKFDGDKATIYLPPINVTDHTEVLFRNLIALEQCQASGDNYVTSYLSLMDNLMDTKEDVAVLRESGIVKNYLGSEAEVAELFNGLCKGVSLPPKDVFEKLHSKVIKHYGSKFKVWFAQFIKDYFSSPWKFLALLGAILALVLTLLQTIYSILAYYK